MNWSLDQAQKDSITGAWLRIAEEEGEVEVPSSISPTIPCPDAWVWWEGNLTPSCSPAHHHLCAPNSSLGPLLFYRHITVPVPRCSIITPPLWPDYTHRYNATQLCNLGKLLTLSGPQFFHLWDGLAVRVYLYGCYELIHYCCCSVTKLCLSLATPWTEMPGFPDPHHLPEFAQVCVHWIRDGIRFDWNIVGLQSCVNCKCMAKWFS